MKQYIPAIFYDLQSAAVIRKASQLPYQAKVLNKKGTLQSRRMLANVYVHKNVIGPSVLTAQGTMDEKKDPYWSHAVYYGVYDKRNPNILLITARLILPINNDIGSLQVHFDELAPAARQEINALPPNTIAEFASYVKRPDLGPVTSRVVSLYLIREMIVDSRRRGITTWVFGLRPELQKKYERLFGSALERCGSTVHLGDFTTSFIPYKVDVEHSWQRFVKASRWQIGGNAVANFVKSAYTERQPQIPRMRPRASH